MVVGVEVGVDVGVGLGVGVGAEVGTGFGVGVGHGVAIGVGGRLGEGAGEGVCAGIGVSVGTVAAAGIVDWAVLRKGFGVEASVALASWRLAGVGRTGAIVVGAGIAGASGSVDSSWHAERRNTAAVTISPDARFRNLIEPC